MIKHKIITTLAITLTLSSVPINAIKIPFIVVQAAKKDAKKLVDNTDQATATAVAYTAFGFGLASHVASVTNSLQNIPVYTQELSVVKKLFFGIAAAAQGIRLLKR